MITVPLGRPSIDNQEINNVVKVLKSGWLTHGEYNLQLEEQLKKYFKIKHVCLLNSCASALLAGLLALDLSINSEVILPSFTFSASANAIILAHLKPVFCDIDINTGNLDVLKLEKQITSKSSAIMPVHFAGQACNMTRIMKIAQKYKLRVIEDSAECIGGKWNNQYAGTFGDLGCFSFWATKNITTGEGGAIITNSLKIAEKVRAVAAHGIESSTLQREKSTKQWLREAIVPGYNFRLSNLQAAVGAAQIKKLNKFNLKRRFIAKRYFQKLKDLSFIKLPLEVKNAYHIYQMYPIQVEAKIRTKFINFLKQNGVQASVHFDPPVHQQPYYRKFSHNSLLETEKLSQSEVTLPIYPDMTLEQIDYVVKIIKQFFA